jgi:hypothetical protein
MQTSFKIVSIAKTPKSITAEGCRGNEEEKTRNGI